MISLTKERAQEILNGIRATLDDIMSVDVPKSALSVSQISDVLEEVRLKCARHIVHEKEYYIQVFEWYGDAISILAIGLPGTECSPGEREYESLRHAIWNLYYNVLEVLRKK